MTTRPTASPPPWHAAALSKYYAIDAQVSGLRSGVNDANGRLGALSRAIAAAENERGQLNEHLSAAPVIRGQEAARHRGIDRAKELSVEIERLQAVRAEAISTRDALAARLARLGPLADRCARLLVDLKLLNRQEIAQ